MDWKREIDIAHMVNQKVAEADIYRLWSHHPPAHGAHENAIVSVERKLGLSLDREHREFLKNANGWDSFFQDVDIFGTSDLAGGTHHLRGMSLLNSVVDIKRMCGFHNCELLPIAASSVENDVFAISMSNTHHPRTVIWFAGEVVDKFPSFAEWFLAMVDYNRREFQRMTGQL